MADKLVCVGGPADGSSSSIDSNSRTLTKVVRRAVGYRFMWGSDRPDEVVEVDTAVYRREKLCVNNDELEFLVYAPMSPIDAVKKLLEDHRP